MEMRFWDIAPEYLCPVIESAQAQGWKLVSAMAHDLTPEGLYHCLFMPAADRDIDGADLDLSGYAVEGK